MQYRKFGNTGIDISVLGFGVMRIPQIQKGEKHYIDEDKALPLLYRAYELGVNYFDSAPLYCNGNSEGAMGKALASVRDKVYLSTKLVFNEYEKKGDLRRALEKSLERIGTDYIDFYHFWGINKGTADAIIENDMMAEIAECKEQGLLRHMSFSFHDAAENMKYIIDNVELASVLCQYNLLDRSNEEMIAYARQQGLGTVIMGPVGGGRLSPPSELYEKLLGKKSTATYELALRYVLGNPNVDCALSGMETLEMLEKNVEVANNAGSISTDEWEQLGEAMQEVAKLRELYCTGCRYCLPCPAEIDIPRLFEIYTHAHVYGLGEGMRGPYKEYKLSSWSGEIGTTFADCTGCGTCETKCPQKIKIQSELERVCKVLEAL
ncbi:MAG: aldo/keto reductase [Lachnospiraceae bacterium]|jgi:predicted aldo/keto reductase-like oxidoreductase|nr:aldo/keto reductase [Lachnospiraceae bacterium]